MRGILKEDRISFGGRDYNCTNLGGLPLLLYIFYRLALQLRAPKCGIGLEFQFQWYGELGYDLCSIF